MNPLKMKAALKKIDGLEKEQALSELKKADKYTQDEINEILLSIDDTKKDEPQVIFEEKPKINPKKFVEVKVYEEDGIRMKKINNDNWRKYIEQEKVLNGMREYDFYKVRAIAVFDKVIDAHGNTVEALKGIELLQDKPVMKTRIMAQTARLMNEQIYNSINNSGSSVYYLYANAVEFDV